MGGRGSSYNTSAQPTPIPMPQPPQPQPPQADANGFSDTDTADYHDLYNGRGYYNQQNLDIDTRTSLADYLDPDPLAGSLYNFSQNMNHAKLNQQKLSPQEQFAWDSIVGSMHNLGHNTNLTRYDHGNFIDDKLASIGINGHTGMSVSQLKQALVGMSYTDPRILSTSYNNFKNASNPTTFTTREVKIVYKAKASTQALMPGRGPGGDFGEMLLAPSGTNGKHNNYKIVDVKASGAKARPQGGSTNYLPLNQIEITVEVD